LEKGQCRDTAAGTVVHTFRAGRWAPGGEAVSFKDRKAGAGTASLINVTAIGTSSRTNAMSGNVVSGTINVKNSIARGPGSDIETKSGTRAINVSYSDYATTTAGAVTSGAGNIATMPAFFAPGDYHEAMGSSTIAAGSTDTSMTATDLDGNGWPSTGPDMGAYEYSPSYAGAGAYPGGATACTGPGGTPTGTVATASPGGD